MLKILSLALIATGVLHNTLALFTQRPILRRMHEQGWFNSVNGEDPQVFALLWFLVAGFALMLIGWSFYHLSAADRLGWSHVIALFLLAAAIVFVYPKPGPFLLLALALAFVLSKLSLPRAV